MLRVAPIAAVVIGARSPIGSCPTIRLKDQDHQFLIPDVADDAVATDSVAPQPAECPLRRRPLIRESSSSASVRNAPATDGRSGVRLPQPARLRGRQFEVAAHSTPPSASGGMRSSLKPSSASISAAAEAVSTGAAEPDDHRLVVVTGSMKKRHEAGTYLSTVATTCTLSPTSITPGSAPVK